MPALTDRDNRRQIAGISELAFLFLFAAVNSQAIAFQVAGRGITNWTCAGLMDVEQALVCRRKCSIAGPKARRGKPRSVNNEISASVQKRGRAPDVRALAGAIHDSCALRMSGELPMSVAPASGDRSMAWLEPRLTADMRAVAWPRATGCVTSPPA